MSIQKLLSACCPFLMAPQVEDEDVYFKKGRFNAGGFAKMDYDSDMESQLISMPPRQPKRSKHGLMQLTFDAQEDELRKCDMSSFRMNESEGVALVDEILDGLF